MAKQWSTVIEPKTKLFNIPLKEIKQYKGLVESLVKRNYEVQYKQTILGPLWMIFSLIFSSGIFSVVFGYIGNFSSDGTPYFLFYMTGSIVWDFFSCCFFGNTGVFLDNSYLMGKVYFPRLIMPISNFVFEVIRSFIKFLVCVVVWAVFAYLGQTQFMGISVLLLFPTVLLAGVLGTSLGLIVSCLTIKYRDLNHITGILMQLLMYGSPVLYSANELPKWLQNIVFINPMSAYIEAFRYAMCGSGCIHWGPYLYSTCVTVVLAVIGLVMFNQTEKTFIDLI